MRWMLLTFLQRLAWARGRWWAPHAMVKKYRCRVRPLACRRRTDERRTIMEAKTRLILALLMSSVMVCMVTLLVTFLHQGPRPYNLQSVQHPGSQAVEPNK